MSPRADESPGDRHQREEREHRAAARKLRPTARPYVNALLANIILAGLLIGIPLVRGRLRAEESVRAFGELTACLHAGVVRDSPGLSMPQGHRARFAALVLRAVPEWPSSCDAALERVSPPPATFLLPGAKQGEEEVRTAMVGVRAAYDELARARREGRSGQVPERLLASLVHLTAALAILIEANDLAIDGTHPAFDLEDGPTLVTPSHVPLEVATGGPLLVRPLADGLRAVAADSRAIMVTSARAGVVEQAHVRRPGAARAILDDGTTTLLGWVTSETTCERDPARCAHRLFGLAQVREGPSPTPEVWLAAHPALPLARSYALRGRQLSVLSRASDGATELRVFELPEVWPPPADPDVETTPTPLLSRRTIGLGATRDAVFVGEALAYVDPASSAVAVVPIEAGEPRLSPGSEGAETLLPCGARVLALGAGRARSVSPLDGSVQPAFAAEPRLPVHRPDPLDDTARCAASGAGSAFAWLDRSGDLHLVSDLDAPRAVDVATGVAGFAIARTGDTVFLATWGDDGHREVTLARWWRGREIQHEIVAACWEDGAGLCGSAGLASDGEHVVLFAREGTDLLALAVRGAGVVPLPGLGDR